MKSRSNPITRESGAPATLPAGRADLRGARAEAARLRDVLERINLGVTLHAPDGSIRFANDAAVRILATTRQELASRRSLIGDADVIDDTGQPLGRDRDPLAIALAERAAVREMVLGVRTANRDEREWLLVSAEPLTQGGELGEVLCTFSDITEQRRAHERIRHLAHHDGLTQLPNRELFMDRLGVALVQATRHKTGVALVFIDLDNFKVINDSLGHSLGDSVLRTVARRLGAAVRQADTVSRLGGDEFTLLLPGVQAADDVSRVLRKVQNSLHRPVVLDDREISVRASLGVAVFPQDGQDAETLLKNADTAMYRAKELGRDQTEFYTPALGVRVREQLDIDGRLRKAVSAGELELHYQPVIDLSKGAVCGFEALVRWREPSGRLLAPGEFIPAAETMGAIHTVGVWVMQTACNALRTLRTSDGGPPVLAINLSARQFHAPDIVDLLRGAIRDSGCDPASLELEITESAALHGQETTIDKLKQLKALGVRLAIDDFGTGFSSFAYLQRFPLDTLKIDQSFIRDVASSHSASGITRAIVAVGRQLGLRVVAEGVETEEQLRLLRLLGCDAVQGYLLGVPVCLDEIPAAIAAIAEAWPRYTSE